MNACPKPSILPKKCPKLLRIISARASAATQQEKAAFLPDFIAELFAAKSDPNCTVAPDWYTPLLLAALHKDSQCVSILLSNAKTKIDTFVNGPKTILGQIRYTAMTFAIINDQEELFDLFLNKNELSGAKLEAFFATVQGFWAVKCALYLRRENYLRKMLENGLYAVLETTPKYWASLLFFMASFDAEDFRFVDIFLDYDLDLAIVYKETSVGHKCVRHPNPAMLSYLFSKARLRGEAEVVKLAKPATSKHPLTEIFSMGQIYVEECLEMLDIFVNNGLAVNDPEFDLLEYALLSTKDGSFSDSEELCLRLIELGAKFKESENPEFSILSKIVGKSDPEAIEFVLQHISHFPNFGILIQEALQKLFWMSYDERHGFKTLSILMDKCTKLSLTVKLTDANFLKCHISILKHLFSQGYTFTDAHLLQTHCHEMTQPRFQLLLSQLQLHSPDLLPLLRSCLQSTIKLEDWTNASHTVMNRVCDTCISQLTLQDSEFDINTMVDWYVNNSDEVAEEDYPLELNLIEYAFMKYEGEDKLALLSFLISKGGQITERDPEMNTGFSFRAVFKRSTSEELILLFQAFSPSPSFRLRLIDAYSALIGKIVTEDLDFEDYEKTLSFLQAQDLDLSLKPSFPEYFEYPKQMGFELRQSLSLFETIWTIMVASRESQRIESQLDFFLKSRFFLEQNEGIFGSSFNPLFCLILSKVSIQKKKKCVKLLIKKKEARYKIDRCVTGGSHIMEPKYEYTDCFFCDDNPGDNLTCRNCMLVVCETCRSMYKTNEFTLNTFLDFYHLVRPAQYHEWLDLVKFHKEYTRFTVPTMLFRTVRSAGIDASWIFRKALQHKEKHIFDAED